MRRALVLTDEAARHPFRASLPPHVTANTAPVEIKRGTSALRDALATYTSCFVAVSVYFA